MGARQVTPRSRAKENVLPAYDVLTGPPLSERVCVSLDQTDIEF